MSEWKKQARGIALAFGLGFWAAMGVTMGTVTMSRLLQVELPYMFLIPDTCKEAPCG